MPIIYHKDVVNIGCEMHGTSMSKAVVAVEQGGDIRTPSSPNMFGQVTSYRTFVHCEYNSNIQPNHNMYSSNFGQWSAYIATLGVLDYTTHIKPL